MFTSITAFLGPVNYSLMLLSFFGLLLYYLIVWNQYGRNREISIFPQYYPPTGLDPAGLSYVLGMTYSKRVFIATILTLAMKGCLKIIYDRHFFSSSFRFVRCSDQNIDVSLPETALINKLFAYDNTVTVEREQMNVVGAATEAHEAALQAQFGRYFVSNDKFFYAGMLASFIIIFGFLLFHNHEFQSVISLGNIVTSFGFAVLLLFAPLLFATGNVAAIMAAIAFLGSATAITSFLYIGFSVLLATINAIFWLALSRATPAGDEVIAAAKGFKMFLLATEKERADLHDSPEETAELFEKYLPYAFALDFDQQWCDRFAQRLDATYQPAWYGGNVPYNPKKFLPDLIDSLDTAVSDATRSPPRDLSKQ